MIVTVQEASTKRCQESYGPPLSPTGAIYSTSTVSYGAGSMGYSMAVGTSPSYCIGPACMAWKFAGQTIDGEFTGRCGKVS